MMASMYVLTQNQAIGVENAPSPTTSPTQTCLIDLYHRSSFSGNTPSTTSKSGGGGKANKGSLSLLFDYLDQHYQIWIFSIIIMFMILTLYNTFMICCKSKTEMYGVVSEKDIDYIDEDI